MNVDDELRRLFSDERLELRPSPDAETAVLAGVKRRVRRKRIAIAATGALSALAIAGGSFLVLAPPTPETVQSAGDPTLTLSSVEPSASGTPAPSDSSTPPSSSQRPPSGSGAGTPGSSSGKATTTTNAKTLVGTVRMGPTSYGGLTLGMTKEQAEATGLISPNAQPESKNGCLGYDYKGKPDKASFYSVVISKTRGVVRIDGRGDEVTVEGVGVGSSVAEFEKAYGNDWLTPHGAVGERVVPVPGNTAANYWFLVRNDKVSEVRLELSQQDCYV
ncbi:hypothetical protein JOF53_004301 [Crossiella equi]|uniref:Uncharacterized protein n=1 Tax=Crossiella equi TaxID=130796 RepID=A0ABS5AFR9_9PSEU|nr:hypothetical protein [Crossiella equi]MBP2475429.1 hypothetical protein [Crossiella equi]